MKIMLDHKGFVERFGGVSRYFYEVVKENPEYFDIAMKYSVNEYLKDFNLPIKFIFNNVNFRGKYRLISVINKPNSIRQLLSRKYDIVHLTHYDPYLFPFRKNEILVSTIHDLNFFSRPDLFSSKRAEELKHGQIACAKKSDHLIAVSQNTKRDLVQYLNIPEEKITVIYHGIDKNLRKIEEARLIKEPYILFVGYRGAEYKNFLNAAKAFSILSEKYEDLHLVCTRDDFSKNELELFQQLGIQKRVIHKAASEKELINLYSNAELFIFPSFAEGFGFPLLEAMSCSCPVVCSNTSCFPEIAGNSALYFDPNSIENMVSSMESYLKDSNLKKQMIDRGLERTKLFSWKKSSDQHIELYSSLLGATK